MSLSRFKIEGDVAFVKCEPGLLPCVQLYDSDPDGARNYLLTVQATEPSSDVRFRIGADRSGHEYFYPVAREAEWIAWSELPEDDEAGWDEPDWAKRIDGRFTFADPRCE